MANSRVQSVLKLEDYQNLLELSSELICIVNDKDELQYFNPAFEKVFGQMDLKSLKLSDLLDPCELSPTQTFFENLKKGSSVSALEIKCRKPNGEMVVLSWIWTLIPERNVFLGAARDITENKKMALEKEKADRLFKHTVDSLPILVAYMDLNFRYKFMNAMYHEWAGEMAEHLRSGELEKLVDEKCAQILRENREQALKTGEPRSFEISCKGEGGCQRFLEVRYLPHRNSEGQIEGLMILGLDLTDVKKAHQSLQVTEHKIERILSDGKVGFWEMDALTGKISISENIRERLGLRKDQALSYGFFSGLIHPDDLEKMFFAREQLFRGNSQEVEVRIRRQDGSYMWAAVTCNPIRNERSEVIGMMGTGIDMTERKEIEKAFQDQQMQMMTSSRLSAIGEMASGVAHEINNPLAIIFANAESLKNSAQRGEVTPEGVLKISHKIEATVKRISKIIQSLRALSRDSENDPMELVSVQKILDDTLEICNQKLKNNQVQVKLDIPSRDLMISARPTQISQVLLNLLNNAYDATEGLSDRWIEISARDLGDEVLIAVTDSGSGIPSRFRSKIFDPFFTTKEPSKGTGLGLSVSRNIICSHGGSLGLDPHSEKTRFVIQLQKSGHSADLATERRVQSQPSLC